MENIIRIIKINFCALLAIPFFVLATCAKLISKALEKCVIMVGVIMVIVGFEFAIQMLKHPSESLNMILTIIIIFFICGMIILIIFSFLSLAATLVMYISNLVINFFNVLYYLLYEVYAYLFGICHREYGILGNARSKTACMLSCLIYTILRGVNRSVIFVLSQSVKIFTVLSVVGVCGCIFLTRQYIQEEFGIGLIPYVKLFGTFDRVTGIIMCLLILTCAVIIILSLGVEWKEWGDEMSYSTLQLNDFTNLVNKLDKKEIHSLKMGEDEQVEECNRCMELLRNHIEQITEFIDEATLLLETTNDPILLSNTHAYFNKVEELATELNNKGQVIPVEEFVKYIPEIEKLEKLQGVVLERMRKVREDMNHHTANNNSTYFGGCDTKEQLDKRYHALCKIYHPDGELGDEEIFKIMKNEYEQRIASYV